MDFVKLYLLPQVRHQNTKTPSSVDKKTRSKNTSNILKPGQSGPSHVSTYGKVIIDKSTAGIYGRNVGLHLLVKICPLKQLKLYLGLSKISENSEEFIFRSLSRGKKFSCAIEINWFPIAESEKFYWSSKSSESWLAKLRATQLMIRWGLTYCIQPCVRQTF